MNFEEWIEDVNIENIRIKYNLNRAIYITPNNVKIFQDEYCPSNFLKSIKHSTVIDLILPLNDKTKQIAKEFEGYFITDWYVFDGYCMLGFDNGSSEEQLKKSFEFVKKYKKEFEDNFCKTIFENS